MKKPDLRGFLRRFWPAAALTLAMSALVSLYAPLEMFFTNREEFHFSFFMLAPRLLVLFGLLMACGLAAFVFCYLLYIRLFEAALAAGTVALLCTFLQGLLFSGSLPPLDGTPIDWSAYRMQDLLSVLLWLTVGSGMVLLVRFRGMQRMRPVFGRIALLLTVVMAVMGIGLCIQFDGLRPADDRIVTKDQEFTLSTDRNFIIFVLDAVDSKTFSDMLHRDHPSFAGTLEDFTYYPNTVGAYPFTYHSIPYMLHGQWYENQEDFHTFTARAMDASPLLGALRSQGYRMGVYEQDLQYESDGILDFENVRTVRYEIGSTRRLLREEMHLVWFKYAPFPLKKLYRVDVEAFRRVLRLPEGVEAFRSNNRDFYDDLLSEPSVLTGDRCFRFIHIDGAHVPFRYDRNVNYIDEALGTYPQNIEASMTILGAYLQALKDAGVYDSSVIVVMADHGYGYQRDVPVVGRSNPLLAVKGLGERHPMAESQAPISYTDLQEAYLRLLDGQSGAACFDAREGDDRPRRFLLYYYMQDGHMEEYIQHGHAFDIETLLPTGRVYDAK